MNANSPGGNPGRQQTPPHVTPTIAEGADVWAAWRCWTWRWCGCTYIEDCPLITPLPVRDEPPPRSKGAAS